jgi:cytidylate kinase
MKEHTREEPQILAAAEQQMRAWSLAQEIAEGTVKSHRMDQPHGRLGNYITISREAGAGGSAIGEAVGERLGWEVLDKNLLDCVAERFHLSRPMLEMVDETASNWAYDVLGPWFDHQIVTHEKYVMHLARIVLAAARRGNVVLVGRGGPFLLPRDQGLAVRVVASEKHRVRRIMEKYAMDEPQAKQFVATLDRGRREFVSRFFRRDVADPHLYDLVINVEFLGSEAAVEEILAAWEQVEARRSATPVPSPSGRRDG